PPRRTVGIALITGRHDRPHRCGCGRSVSPSGIPMRQAMVAVFAVPALFSILVDPMSIYGFPVRLAHVATQSRGAGDTMKYLCLVYHEEAKLDALPEDARNALRRETLDCREELGRSG